jgi:hypothetical protein
VRGSDDRENTAIGLGGYFHVNVPRSMVKDLARAIDLTRVIRSKKFTEITLVGAESLQYAEALAMVDYDIVIHLYTLPTLNWSLSGDGYYTLRGSKTKVKAVRGQPLNVIRVDLAPEQLPMHQHPPGVMRVKAPSQITKSFMPSVLLHNLTGWKIDDPQSGKEKVITGDYFKNVDLINYGRTFPAFNSRYRPVRLIEQLYPAYKMPLQNYTKMVRVLKERNIIELIRAGDDNLTDALIAALGRDAIEASISKAEVTKNALEIVPPDPDASDSEDENSVGVEIFDDE